jgi:hypothetical protein
MSSNLKQVNKKAKQKHLDYANTFGSEEGKRVLHDMMRTHKFLTPTLASGNDPIEMAFFEGQRNVILRILTYLNMDVEAINRLVSEGERNVKSVEQRIRTSVT